MTARTKTPERMTQSHTEALLALLVSLDPRLRATDEGSARIRLSAWTTLLAEVEPSFAVKYAERAYQELRDWPLAPAEILTAWREEERTKAEAAGEELFRGPEYWGKRQGLSDPVMLDWVRDAVAAMQRGESLESVPMPVNSRPGLSPEQDAWQRRCMFHRICACDHRSCRDGILDAEEQWPGPFGLYPVVKRCPFCKDAIDMAVEQGIAKRPSAHARRRAS